MFWWFYCQCRLLNALRAKHNLSGGHNRPCVQVRVVYVQKRSQNVGAVRGEYGRRADFGARRHDVEVLV